MKTKLIFTFFSFLTLSHALADNLPNTVNIALKKAFIPSGFDDNDRSQIAVEGLFPNTCYRVGPHAIKVDEAYKTVTIQQQAYLYGGMCLQMFVPFTQVIDLGLLSDGKYKILDAESGASLGSLDVAKSKNLGPDDFLYAPITDAYVTFQPSVKTNTLVLTGNFGDRCSDFEEIKVLYQDQVVVVQPVVKRTTENPCTPQPTRFLKTVELKQGVQGIHLLHVRSLNGQAINKMVDLQ